MIYRDDHPPAHVHVTGRGIAKIELEPVIAVLQNRNLSKADIRRVIVVVRSWRDEMIEAWKQIHG